MEVRKSVLCSSTGHLSAVHRIFNNRLNSAINEIKAFELQENPTSCSYLIVLLTGTSVLLFYRKISTQYCETFFIIV